MSATLHRTEGAEAYDLIDRFLRNNLDDSDYAEYSKALDSLLASHAGEPVAYANPVILLPDEDGEEWTAKVQGNRDDVFSLPLYTAASGAPYQALAAAARRLEEACNRRAALLPREAYLAAEGIDGMREVLDELDSARKAVRVALTPPAPNQGEAS